MPTDLTPVTAIQTFLAAADKAAARTALELDGIAAANRAFRTLGDEAPVLYTDGGIKFTAANSWVSLPAVDEAKIGALFLFYGINAGISCGFYSDEGNIIIPPHGSAINYFTVPNNGVASVQLDDEGHWRVALLDPGVYTITAFTGSLTLDRQDGPVQYFNHLTSDSTIEATGGVDMDEIEVGIGWVESTPTLSFGSSIKLPADLSALMPVTLEEFRSYGFTLQKRGGNWTLKGPVQGPTIETEG